MKTKPTRIIMQLTKTDYAPYLKNSTLIPDNCEVYITNTLRGKAHRDDWNGHYITIPKHAILRDWGYFIYYIAHELAHVNTWNIFRLTGYCKEFFGCFVQLCPKEYQKYEYSYKPSFGRYNSNKFLNE